jgi:hypothetical protein
MYKYCFVVLLFLAACTSNEVVLDSDAAVKPSQFVQAFKVIKDGFEAKDSNVYRFADTQKISLKVLASVVPDSILKQWVAKEPKTVFKPVGRIEKAGYNYLLLLIQKPKKNGLVTLVFDKNNKLVCYKNLLAANENFDKNYMYAVSINKEPTFYITREKYTSSRELKFTKTGWALSNNNFIVVVNESNEVINSNEPIINPIDTLPINNKYSGNYTVNDRNILSVRDGYTPREYKFFLYMEKDNGKCVGELKGTMVLTDDEHATYTASGDPCVIDFTFNGNSITMKEKGSCGNRRSLDCLFEDTYIKRKLVRKTKQPIKPKQLPKNSKTTVEVKK